MLKVSDDIKELLSGKSSYKLDSLFNKNLKNKSHIRNMNTGYKLLNLLNACIEDKKQIPVALVSKILNHKKYTEYRHLGFPDKDGLNKMDIRQLFSFYNALDVIDEAYSIFKKCINYESIERLQELNKPNLMDYDSLISFIDRLKTLNNAGSYNNYTNIRNPFDFFSASTIKSMSGLKIIDVNELKENTNNLIIGSNELKENTRENFNKILGSKNDLYCVSIKDYDNYIKMCEKECKVKLQIEESEKNLNEIKNVEKQIKTFKTTRLIVYLILVIGSSYICNEYELLARQNIGLLGSLLVVFLYFALASIPFSVSMMLIDSYFPDTDLSFVILIVFTFLPHSNLLLNSSSILDSIVFAIIIYSVTFIFHRIPLGIMMFFDGLVFRNGEKLERQLQDLIRERR